MSDLQIFNNEQFGQIRTLNINGKIHFVAVDIAKALGYKNIQDAIKRHCRWVVKHEVPHPQSPNKTMEVNVIPEGDIYRLVANSELPGAEKFESWIFDEVVPQIFRTGGYIPKSEEDSEQEILAKAFIIAQNTIAAKNKELEEKNRFINQIAISKNTLLVREVAKIASKANIVIGEKRLWNKLREWGLIFKNSTEPIQEYVNRGYFEVVEGSKESSKGVFTYYTTRVTGKGQKYIIERLIKESAN